MPILSGCIGDNRFVRFVGRSNGATTEGVAVAEDLNASTNGEGIDANNIANVRIFLRTIVIDDCFILIFSVPYSAIYGTCTQNNTTSSNKL